MLLYLEWSEELEYFEVAWELKSLPREPYWVSTRDLGVPWSYDTESRWRRERNSYLKMRRKKLDGLSKSLDAFNSSHL